MGTRANQKFNINISLAGVISLLPVPFPTYCGFLFEIWKLNSPKRVRIIYENMRNTRYDIYNKFNKLTGQVSNRQILKQKPRSPNALFIIRDKAAKAPSPYSR